MRATPTQRPRHLRAREVIDIRNGQGLAVRCLAGSLWITQDGDSDDVVVKAGECFVLDRRGLALVSAPDSRWHGILTYIVDPEHHFL